MTKYGNSFVVDLSFFLHVQKGKTPLFYASEQGKNDLVQLLLEHCAEVDLPADVSN